MTDRGERVRGAIARKHVHLALSSGVPPPRDGWLRGKVGRHEVLGRRPGRGRTRSLTLRLSGRRTPAVPARGVFHGAPVTLERWRIHDSLGGLSGERWRTAP